MFFSNCMFCGKAFIVDVRGRRGRPLRGKARLLDSVKVGERGMTYSVMPTLYEAGKSRRRQNDTHH